MSKNKLQEEFLVAQLNKIAASLSQTGRYSRANMIRFDIPQTYNILKIKDWLRNRCLEQSWYTPEDVKANKQFFKLDDSSSYERIYGIDAEATLTQLLSEEIDSAIKRERKNTFKAEPNGKR